MMKHFEVGKIYGTDGIEIIVTKRTKQSITFKYTKPNWWEQDTEKEFRKKIQTCYKDFEGINLDNHWSGPHIDAI